MVLEWPRGTANRSFLTRGGLTVRLVRVGLVRFVVADYTTSRSAQLAMSRHMPSDAADNGSLDAAFGIRTGGVSQRDQGRGKRY
jgi:hypothetical protein